MADNLRVSYRRIRLLTGKVLSRGLLNRTKDAVDPKLRDQQVGFTDQTVALIIILEQACKWNFPLYVSFIDYDEAFDSPDRQFLWTLMRCHGVLEKITNIIRNS